MSSLFIVEMDLILHMEYLQNIVILGRSSLRIILMHLNIVMKLYLCLIINILMKRVCCRNIIKHNG